MEKIRAERRYFLPLTRLLQIKVLYSQIPSLLGARLFHQLSWEFYGEMLKWQYTAHLRGFSQWGHNRGPPQRSQKQTDSYLEENCLWIKVMQLCRQNCVRRSGNAGNSGTRIMLSMDFSVNAAGYCVRERIYSISHWWKRLFYKSYAWHVCVFYYLPHAGLFAVHHSHVVDFVLLDAPLLRLIELLRNEAHEWVVWCVS